MSDRVDDIRTPQLYDGIVFADERLDDLRKLAATGLSPQDIARALELPQKDIDLFVEMARKPLSRIGRLMAEGRAYGLAKPQLTAFESAEGGNLQALQTLMKYQDRNRFREMIAAADDDELSL